MQDAHTVGLTPCTYSMLSCVIVILVNCVLLVSGDTLCPSKVTQNLDTSRIPPSIVETECDGSCIYFCHDRRQCVQLRASIDVYYWTGDKRIISEPELLTYNAGCVCADVCVNKALEVSVNIVH